MSGEKPKRPILRLNLSNPELAAKVKAAVSNAGGDSEIEIEETSQNQFATMLDIGAEMGLPRPPAGGRPTPIPAANIDTSRVSSEFYGRSGVAADWLGEQRKLPDGNDPLGVID